MREHSAVRLNETCLYMIQACSSEACHEADLMHLNETAVDFLMQD